MHFFCHKPFSRFNEVHKLQIFFDKWYYHPHNGWPLFPPKRSNVRPTIVRGIVHLVFYSDRKTFFKTH